MGQQVCTNNLTLQGFGTWCVDRSAPALVLFPVAVVLFLNWCVITQMKRNQTHILSAGSEYSTTISVFFLRPDIDFYSCWVP